MMETMEFNERPNFTINTRLEDISPLPGKLDKLSSLKEEKTLRYRSCIEDLTHIDPADANAFRVFNQVNEKAKKIDKEIESVDRDLAQCLTDLNILVTEKLADTRIMLKQLSDGGSEPINDNPLLQEVENILESAGGCLLNKDLTAALLKVHQAHIALMDLAKVQMNNWMNYHSNRSRSL